MEYKNKYLKEKLIYYTNNKNALKYRKGILSYSFR